jgi:hypothetical protein
MSGNKYILNLREPSNDLEYFNKEIHKSWFIPGTKQVKFNFFYDNNGKPLLSDSFPETVTHIEFDDMFTNGREIRLTIRKWNS